MVIHIKNKKNSALRRAKQQMMKVNININLLSNVFKGPVVLPSMIVCHYFQWKIILFVLTKKRFTFKSG